MNIILCFFLQYANKNIIIIVVVFLLPKSTVRDFIYNIEKKMYWLVDIFNDRHVYKKYQEIIQNEY